MKSETLVLVVFCLFGFTVYADSENSDKKRFLCSGKRSVELQRFCDGEKNCPGGEDEIPSGISEPTGEWQSCVNSINTYNGSCSVRRELICNEDVVCSNVNPCDLQCNKTHYRCQGSNKCVHRNTICNKNSCDGCPDTTEWKNGVGFKCRRLGNECILPQQLVEDDVSDCDGEVDRCFRILQSKNGNKRVFLRNNCFRCLNEEMIIPRQSVCDGVIDCSDLSDECLCEGNKSTICDKVIQYKNFDSVSGSSVMRNQSIGELAVRIGCKVGAVSCNRSYCISRSSVCDGIKDCDSDEGFDYCRGTISCGDATKSGELCRCQSSSRVCKAQYGKSCDGKDDCGNAEDECGACIKNSTVPNQCHVLHSVMDTELQPGPIICKGGKSPSDTNDTSTLYPNYIFIQSYRICDGVADCDDGDDEENCGNRLKCDALQPGYVSVSRDQTCDGIINCDDGKDEAEERCNRTRFRCEVFDDNRVSIDVSMVCDGILNCNDGKDEMNCSEDGRFYCEGGEPLFVKKAQKFDGRGDCLDWTDECPIKNPVKTDGFSSRYDMIGNPVLRAIVWIMALLSIGGNSAVIFLVTKQLKSSRRSSPIDVANKMFVLKLAVADILMGVYLLGLGIAGAVTKGNYCSVDLKWRSSSSCLAFGVLAVLSSESSVMMMIALAGFRLYAVFQPLKSLSNPKKKVVALMIAAIWSLALTMSLIPLARSLSSTFITHAEFRYNPFIKNVPTSLREARKIFMGLMTYDAKVNATHQAGSLSLGSLSFYDIEEWGSKLFVHEHFTIIRVYGYYSTHSVCLPKFFTEKSDPSWQFSFFVNLFNFLAFIFVAGSYIAIYIYTQRKSDIRSKSSTGTENNSSDLQTKILRLIITDFCCWIPICITSFIKLGGIYVSNEVYVYAAIILLPINSALNPILYSSVLDVFYRKATKLISSSDHESYSTKNTAVHARVSHSSAL